MLNLQPIFMQNPNERPVLYYNIMSADHTWGSAQTWGGWCGTKGQKRTTMGLKMWFGYGYSNYHIFYQPHHQSEGWAQVFYYDGQEAWKPKRLEAFIYYILKY